jgi:hypothetical protein
LQPDPLSSGSASPTSPPPSTSDDSSYEDQYRHSLIVWFCVNWVHRSVDKDSKSWSILWEPTILDSLFIDFVFV